MSGDNTFLNKKQFHISLQHMCYAILRKKLSELQCYHLSAIASLLKIIPSNEIPLVSSPCSFCLPFQYNFNNWNAQIHAAASDRIFIFYYKFRTAREENGSQSPRGLRGEDAKICGSLCLQQGGSCGRGIRGIMHAVHNSLLNADLFGRRADAKNEREKYRPGWSVMDGAWVWRFLFQEAHRLMLVGI